MKFSIIFIATSLFYACAFAQDCKGGLKSQWNNCFGTYNSWYGTYIGNFKNGKKHGEGTIHYYNGDKFIGEFKDGKKMAKVLLLILVVKQVLETGKMIYISVIKKILPFLIFNQE